MNFYPLTARWAATPVRLRAARVMVVQKGDGMGRHPAQQAWMDWKNTIELDDFPMKTHTSNGNS